MEQDVEKLNELIEKKAWKTVMERYPIKEYCDLIPLEKGLSIASQMVVDGFSNSDSDIQGYAINTLLEMRARDISNWESSWKNDFKLGELCRIYGMKEEEEYAAYRRAYILCLDPPIELLLAVSDCRGYPGAPNISDEEAEVILEKALKKNPDKGALYLINQRLRNIRSSRKETVEHEEIRQNNKKRLRACLDAHNWQAVGSTFTPETLFKLPLSLESVLLLTYSVYFNLDLNDEPQPELMTPTLCKETVSLLRNAQKEYSSVSYGYEWQKNWKNDVYLAYFCYFGGKYSEMLTACKRALESTQKQNSEVLSLTAYCEGLPGVTDITTEEAKNLCEQAFQMNQSPLAAEKLRQIYDREHNREQAAYWDSVCKQLAQEGRKEQIILPEVLSDPRIAKHLVPYIEKHLTIIAT